MKIIGVVVLLLVLNVAFAQDNMKHQFLDLGSMNPLTMVSVMSGDYAALLPQPFQQIGRKILGQQQKTGVAGFVQQAQGLLGGGGSSNPIESLMGGQSAGSGIGSLLGLGGNQPAPSNTGLTSLFNSFTGSNAANTNSGFDFGSILGTNTQPASSGGLLDSTIGKLTGTTTNAGNSAGDLLSSAKGIFTHQLHHLRQ